MSSSNKRVRIKRELPSDDDESKPTVQSGAASTFAGPVKLEETASQVRHVFGHMVKCTLGPNSRVLPVNSREILEENLDELDSPLMDLYRAERRLKELEEVKKANSLESSSNMSSSNEPVRIKRELPDDDDESKSTVQSGTTSSSHVRPVIKQEQFDESESKPIHQLEATYSFAGPVKQENVHVKQEKIDEPMCHVFGHMAKCTLGNQCTTPNCSTLKAIANHLFDCARSDCSICGPFQPQINNPLPQVSAQPIPISQIHVPSPNILQNSLSQAPFAQPPSSRSQTNHTDTEQFDFLLNKLKNSKNNPNAYKETLQQVLNILKANPNLMETFIEKRQELEQLQQQLQQQSQSPFNQSHNPQVFRQPVAFAQIHVPNPHTFQDHAAQLQQQQQSESSFNQSNSSLPQVSHQPISGTQVNVSVPQPNTSQPQVSGLQPYATMTPTQALQQLLALLRTARNDQEAQQQLLNLLKSQPALMASFIKQRQQQLRHQELERQQAKQQQQHD